MELKDKVIKMETWSNTYPRPQFKRDSFYSLNGEWTLNGQNIIVPYPPQSSLSQYHGEITEQLQYQKTFTLPSDFYQKDDRIILHFGAVDQIAKVSINHHELGEHQGGYLPFSFDITDFIKEDNNLIVDVIDTLSHDYPYGKQRKDRGGMWYTPVSGIWQTVWIEAVPPLSIESIKMTPTLSTLHLEVQTKAPRYQVSITFERSVFVDIFTEHSIDIEIPEKERFLWTPEHPYLYSITIASDTDHIESYFALRTISIENQQVLLNNQPIFLNGVLDQGYFIDGLFLPKGPQGYLEDIMNMKELGMNTLRKHIKVEPDIFYYLCDLKGMLVVQDMVNNGPYHYYLDTVLPTIGFQYRFDCFPFEQKRKDIFIKHSLETIQYLHNHPAIIIYTIFNEGWGQFDTNKIYHLLKKTDPSRLYDSASGWFKKKDNDFESLHVYFRNKVLKTKKNKPIFLSECGGYKRFIDNHVFNPLADYGYGSADSEEELTGMIETMYKEMVFPSLKNGLCGMIYTQVSDVEDEINGLYTYDREVCKVNKEKMRSLAQKVKDYINYEKR